MHSASRPPEFPPCQGSAGRNAVAIIVISAAVGLLIAGSGFAVAQAAAPSSGDYTQQQARAGQPVFANRCASCHGSNMQGQSGPPLAGSNFASNLQFSKQTAKQLFDFAKQQMPADAPGSLSDKQYREVFAYILSKNGYPAGHKQLTDQSVSSIKLLPYPGKNGQSQ